MRLKMRLWLLPESLAAAQFEMVQARFLAPLVEARGFGMTPIKTRPN